MNSDNLTPIYFRYLVHLIRPFPNFDLFFVQSLRREAVDMLHLKSEDRVLDVGCGPGGRFPCLLEAVGPAGEVVGVEISPEVAINARRRITANRWLNVRVLEGDAETVTLDGDFNGLLMLGAPDAYAIPQALNNLLQYLKPDAVVVAFGAKLTRRFPGRLLNLLFRSVIRLSFSSTPALNYEPWAPLADRLAEIHVREYLLGCLFLAWGSGRRIR